MPAGDGELLWGLAGASHLTVGLWWPGTGKRCGASLLPEILETGPLAAAEIKAPLQLVMLHGRLTLRWLPAPKTSTK